MRVLVTVTPVVGHLHPLIPFASAAAAAGHDVVFATGAGLAGAVRGCGFACFPVGSDWVSHEDSDRMFPEMRGTVAKERAALAWLYIFAGHYPKAAVGDLVALAEAWRPDIVVRDDTNFGGCIAAERLGIPHAAVQTVAFRPNLYQLIRAPLNDRRREAGLPPDPDGAMPFRDLFFSPFPPSYLKPDITLPATTRWVRPVPFDRSGDDTLPEWVNRLTDRPLVYLTLGTLFNHRADIFSAFIEGLRDEPLELAVTVGRDQDPARFGPQPGNVHVERYIPQTVLFPRCSLVVSHGGSGTTMAALAEGLPMVVVPIAADQHENAERCAALGAARVCPADDLSPEAARHAVLEVLTDPSYRRASGDLRDEINAMPGPESAVGLLEDLAAGRSVLRAGESPSRPHRGET